MKNKMEEKRGKMLKKINQQDDLGLWRWTGMGGNLGILVEGSWHMVGLVLEHCISKT